MNAEHTEAWRHGVHLFDSGRYWDCHEALEPAWLVAGGMEKRFLGGVILLAAALHKARSMGSARGGRRNFAKALAKLALVGDRYYGIDVRELEARVHQALRDPEARPSIPLLHDPSSEQGQTLANEPSLDPDPTLEPDPSLEQEESPHHER